jgi:hypothetical protein
MKYSFSLVLCVFFLSMTGCGSSMMDLVRPGVGMMSPRTFASDSIMQQLAEAVDRGDEAAIAAAIKAGGDVNATGAGGFRLLYWAMARANVKGFEQLLYHGASLDADYRDPKYLPDVTYRETVLEHVLGSSDTRFLEAALRQGLDPNYVPHPEDKLTLLFIAVSRHSVPAIKALVAAGADVDRRDTSGYTPLIDARMCRAYKEAWALLQCGADPTVRDDLGHDFVWGLKEYGSLGVRPDDRASFEAIVAELVKRSLLTRQDIVDADKRKWSSSESAQPGITVIEHSPDSEAGQAILRLDQFEREANQRDGR